MRLTMVTNVRFWNRAMGSQERVLALLTHLTGAGHDVAVFFAGSAEDADLARAQTLVPGLSGVTPARRGAPHGQATTPAARLKRALPQPLRDAAKQLLGRGTAETGPRPADFATAERRAALRAHLERAQPEVVLVEYLHMVPLAAEVREVVPGARLIVDTHDVMNERAVAYRRNGQIPDVDVTAAEEAEILGRCDAAIGIQPQDAAKLRRLVPHLPILTVMHPHALHAAPAERHEGPPRALFVGSPAAPNVDALAWLAEDIWPRIRHSLPEATLTVAGNVCRAFEGRALPAGVDAAGFVGDLGPLYEDADVIINPVRFGSGLKIKNVEALCRARPLVTTSVGAEGMETGAGKAFLQADNPADMSDLILGLLVDAEGRRTLAAEAHAYAARTFAPEVVFRDLDDWLAAPTAAMPAAAVTVTTTTAGPAIRPAGPAH